jgi:hypothetical protein
MFPITSLSFLQALSGGLDLIFFFWSLFLSAIMSLVVLVCFHGTEVNQERRYRLALGYWPSGTDRVCSWL